MNITILRFAYTVEATLNYWIIGGERVFCGLGEPWLPDPDGPGGQAREGALHESCIPDGNYALRPHTSPKYPGDQHVYYFENEALGVWAPGRKPGGQRWGRDAILVHNGTTTIDIRGCELVGKRHGYYSGMPAVFDSVVALRELRELLKMGTHTVEIRPVKGTSEVPP